MKRIEKATIIFIAIVIIVFVTLLMSAVRDAGAAGGDQQPEPGTPTPITVNHEIRLPMLKKEMCREPGCIYPVIPGDN